MKKVLALVVLTVALTSCKKMSTKVESGKDTVDTVVKDTVSVVKDTTITVDTLKKK